MVRALERRLTLIDIYLMASTWVVDLRHFLTPAGALAAMPRPARVLAEYWAQIVSQGSLFDEPVTLRCRRRPARRPCTGTLNIGLDLDLDGIVWDCPVCGDNGIIRGWQGTFWDNSELPERL
jgi:predicted RNA-binding Zn-ribbon protein involved in translation (DUF1610 family)